MQAEYKSFCMLKNMQIKWRSPTSQRFGFFRQILNLRENESRNILIFSLQKFWCYVLHSEWFWSKSIDLFLRKFQQTLQNGRKLQIYLYIMTPCRLKSSESKISCCHGIHSVSFIEKTFKVRDMQDFSVNNLLKLKCKNLVYIYLLPENMSPVTPWSFWSISKLIWSSWCGRSLKKL